MMSGPAKDGPGDRLWRRISSERGSVFAEYAMLSAFVTLFAVLAFTPGSSVNEAVGCDFNTRQFFMRLPLF